MSQSFFRDGKNHYREEDDGFGGCVSRGSTTSGSGIRMTDDIGDGDPLGMLRSILE